MRKDREGARKAKETQADKKNNCPPDRLIPTGLSTPKKTNDFLITPHQLIQLPSCAVLAANRAVSHWFLGPSVYSILTSCCWRVRVVYLRLSSPKTTANLKKKIVYNVQSKYGLTSICRCMNSSVYIYSSYYIHMLVESCMIQRTSL
jgi:hypothetical protein